MDYPCSKFGDFSFNRFHLTCGQITRRITVTTNCQGWTWKHSITKSNLLYCDESDSAGINDIDSYAQDENTGQCTYWKLAVNILTYTVMSAIEVIRFSVCDNDINITVRRRCATGRARFGSMHDADCSAWSSAAALTACNKHERLARTD